MALADRCRACLGFLRVVRAPELLRFLLTAALQPWAGASMGAGADADGGGGAATAMER